MSDVPPRERAKTPRETYRHGDLRPALIAAGLALARAGGPEAVLLREVTRQAGVVPNAAYRHFACRDALLHAVREAALHTLADAIERDLAAIDRDMKRKAYARASLRAFGLRYLGFAAAEPGLFRTAFVVTTTPPPALDLSGTPAGGPNLIDLIGSALDRMVAADLMPPHRRPGAEVPVWAMIHGLAVLHVGGALGPLGAGERDALGERLIRMAERGL